MKITLHFWQGGAGPFESGMVHERVFVHVSGTYRPLGCGVWDKGCLGFWEQMCRQTVIDKHISRGAWSAAQWFSGEVPEAAILEAVGVGAAEIARAAADFGGGPPGLDMASPARPGGLFVAVARKARNGYPTWELTTPLDEAARLRSERDSAAFDLAGEVLGIGG